MPFIKFKNYYFLTMLVFFAMIIMVHSPQSQAGRASSLARSMKRMLEVEQISNAGLSAYSPSVRLRIETFRGLALKNELTPHRYPNLRDDPRTTAVMNHTFDEASMTSKETFVSISREDGVLHGMHAQNRLIEDPSGGLSLDTTQIDEFSFRIPNLPGSDPDRMVHLMPQIRDGNVGIQSRSLVFGETTNEQSRVRMYHGYGIKQMTDGKLMRVQQLQEITTPNGRMITIEKTPDSFKITSRESTDGEVTSERMIQGLTVSNGRILGGGGLRLNEGEEVIGFHMNGGLTRFEVYTLDSGGRITRSTYRLVGLNGRDSILVDHIGFQRLSRAEASAYGAQDVRMVTHRPRGTVSSRGLTLNERPNGNTASPVNN